MAHLLLTPVRGKCRHGNGHESCTLTDRGWWGEDGSGYECQLAPPRPCPPCGGLGYFQDPRVNAADERTDEQRRRMCLRCKGRGEIPGLHHPWRQPAPRGA